MRGPVALVGGPYIQKCSPTSLAGFHNASCCWCRRALNCDPPSHCGLSFHSVSDVWLEDPSICKIRTHFVNNAKGVVLTLGILETGTSHSASREGQLVVIGDCMLPSAHTQAWPPSHTTARLGNTAWCPSELPARHF